MDAVGTVLLERCARIGTSTWSDALDEFGIEGVVRGLIQRSGRDRCAGFAVTIKQSTGRLGAYPRGDFGAGKIVEASGPGRVPMVDMGGAEVSTFGGLAALATSIREPPASSSTAGPGTSTKSVPPVCGWRAGS